MFKKINYLKFGMSNFETTGYKINYKKKCLNLKLKIT